MPPKESCRIIRRGLGGASAQIIAQADGIGSSERSHPNLNRATSICLARDARDCALNRIQISMLHTSMPTIDFCRSSRNPGALKNTYRACASGRSRTSFHTSFINFPLFDGCTAAKVSAATTFGDRLSISVPPSVPRFQTEAARLGMPLKENRQRL